MSCFVQQIVQNPEIIQFTRIQDKRAHPFWKLEQANVKKIYKYLHLFSVDTLNNCLSFNVYVLQVSAEMIYQLMTQIK